MRLLITVLLVSLAVACSARPADDDYVYEDEPSEAPPAPSTKAPSRHGVAGLRQARGPSPLLASRSAKTTAAPVKPVEPEVVNEPEDINDEGPLENEEVVPATEAPKKTPLRGMIVRPFRSNQELLAALKRKRAQEHWRVVYEYLYIRFGYPVNLHHKLDIVPDPDIGGDNDARLEINEVTSGDNDPPAKLKPREHEPVVGLQTQGQVQGDVTGELKQGDQTKVKQEQVEPVNSTNFVQEVVEKVKVTNIKPLNSTKDKEEVVEKVKVTNIKPVSSTNFGQEVVEKVKVSNIKPVSSTNFGQEVVEKVKVTNVKPVNSTNFGQEVVEKVKVTNIKPVNSTKDKEEQLEPVLEISVKSVDPIKVKREHVLPEPAKQEKIRTLSSVKIEPAKTSGGVSTHPPSVTTPTPVEVKPNSKGATATRSNSNNNSSSGRRTFSRPNKATTAAAPEVLDEAEPTPKKSFPSSNRRFTATRGKPAPVTEDAEGDAADEPPSRSAKSFRGGRRA